MEEEPREVTSGFVSKKSLREGKLASYARLGNVNSRLYLHKLSNMTGRRTPCTQRSCIFALSAIFWPSCDTSQPADQRLGTAGAACQAGGNGHSNGYTAVAEQGRYHSFRTAAVASTTAVVRQLWLATRRTQTQGTHSSYLGPGKEGLRLARRSEAAMAAAAAPGSAAPVIGRPITSKSAPERIASSGVATRA